MQRIIGEIPARLGSQRVPKKNLRLIAGKPLIRHAIDAARAAKTLTEVYVNSEAEELRAVAEGAGVRFYKRDAALASHTASSDEFNYDFIKGTRADVLVLVNPVSPLILPSDIDGAVNRFLESGCDTLIASRRESLQAYCAGKPVNFDPGARLAPTQDLPPIDLLAWSVCVWRASTFVAAYEARGHAVFSGKVELYPMSHLRCVKISEEDDFLLAEALLEYRERRRQTKEVLSDG